MRARRGLVMSLTLVACISIAHAGAAPPRTLVQECPLLSASPLASAQLVALPPGVLLQAGSVTVAEQDVNGEIPKASPDLRPQLERSRLFLLGQLAVQRTIGAEAEQWVRTTRRGPRGSTAARLQAYLSKVVPAPTVTEADLRQFFEENKDAFGGASFEQVKPQLTSYVLRQKREAAQQQYVNTLSDRTQMQVADAWVKAQYRELINNPVDIARLSGRPSMVDFGAEGCVACETMAPILTLLSDELKDKANVLFVEVRKEQVLGSRFGVRTIPLQVFFNREGREVFRHVGVFPEAQIRAKLAELGVK